MTDGQPSAASSSEPLARVQRRKLAALLDTARARNAFYRAKLAGTAFDPLRDPLARLPFTTREELQADQQACPPFGTNLSAPLEDFVHYHQTSGSAGGLPLRWLDTAESWHWWQHCWGVIFDAAGVTRADRIAFPFSFGPFIGFWSAFAGAEARGNLCLPAGGMTTAARLRFLRETGATVVCCTPTYALHMAEVAQAEGLELRGGAVRTLLLAGEPGANVPGVRTRIESAWGARAFDHAGMTEVGPWGVEFAAAPGGLHVIETEFIAEVIDPATGQELPDGATGELVLTNLGRSGSPLIRYRTGDQVRLTRDPAACAAAGGWARCEGGVLGRTDDMLIIRGNNVFPATIEGILREVAGVGEYRLRVTGRAALDELVIEVEPAPGSAAGGDLAARVQKVIQDRLLFRPAVELVAPGVLPRFEFKARRVVRDESAPARAGAGGSDRLEDRP